MFHPPDHEPSTLLTAPARHQRSFCLATDATGLVLSGLISSLVGAVVAHGFKLVRAELNFFLSSFANNVNIFHVFI